MSLKKIIPCRHYSMLGVLGGESLSRIQEMGAGVYFNVPSPDDGRYAVIL